MKFPDYFWLTRYIWRERREAAQRQSRASASCERESRLGLAGDPLGDSVPGGSARSLPDVRAGFRASSTCSSRAGRRGARAAGGARGGGAGRGESAPPAGAREAAAPAPRGGAAGAGPAGPGRAGAAAAGHSRGAAAAGAARRAFPRPAASRAMRTVWLALCALARLWPGALGGCADAGRCCPGRDPACFARGWRLDRVYGTCFCDQACLLTGDCCFDYARACPGEWRGL